LLLLRILVFFAGAILVGLLVNKLFNFGFSRLGNKGRFTVFAVSYCFLMAFLAEEFGLADITGAFLAGIALCNTRGVEFIETKTHELSYVFFTPIFLANIGIQTSFEGVTRDVALFTGVLVLVAIASKVIGCGLGAKICKYTNRESLQIGIGMVARGEVSFIVVAKGMAIGYVSSLLFPTIIVVVMVTVLITPLLLKVAYAEKA